jgi:uncharacterized membrane protein YidH (DUF202 family)
MITQTFLQNLTEVNGDQLMSRHQPMNSTTATVVAGVIFTPVLVYVFLITIGAINPPDKQQIIGVFLFAVAVLGAIGALKFLGVFDNQSRQPEQNPLSY